MKIYGNVYVVGDGRMEVMMVECDELVLFSVLIVINDLCVLRNVGNWMKFMNHIRVCCGRIVGALVSYGKLMLFDILIVVIMDYVM